MGLFIVEAAIQFSLCLQFYWPTKDLPVAVEGKKLYSIFLPMTKIPERLDCGGLV